MWGNGTCPGVGSFWGAGFGLIFTILFWAFVLWAIFTLFKWAREGRLGQKEDVALSILEQRYVKGELTKEQFEEMKKELRGK